MFAVEAVDEALARTRFPLLLIGSLIGFLAASALVLASVGLFALTAHGVAARTHEIGIRMALGAQARQVQWLFVRGTLLDLVVGLAIGTAGALATGRLLQSLLERTSARDPLTLALVAVLVIAVSLTACILPARRASRLDPVAALRHE